MDKALIIIVLSFLCSLRYRRDSGAEEAEDGEGEGGIPHHVPQRDKHSVESTAREHSHRPGKRASASTLIGFLRFLASEN